MERLNITKDAEVKFDSDSLNIYHVENTADIVQQVNNCKIFKNALDTYNHTPILPSELAKENLQLKEFIESIQKRTQKQSIFDDIETFLNNLKNK